MKNMKKENKRKKRISILLTICMVVALLPLPRTAFASAPLYKVVPEHGAPFRAEEDGSIIGNIPQGTVLQVFEIKKGGYAKVKWDIYLVYVWTDNLKAVDAPDSVCSKWSQEWITSMEGEYVGLKSRYPTAECDLTKPLKRIDMVEEMMLMLVPLFGRETRQGDYPIVNKGNWPLVKGIKDSHSQAYRNANYLASWGLVPTGRFRPNDYATYGEVVDAMIKIMAYDNKYNCIYNYGAPRTVVTKKMIASLGIGGDTRSKAPCTIEQIRVMRAKLECWAADYNLRWYAADAKAGAAKKTHEGLFCIVSGTYTIQTALGEERKHPYLNINKAGEGELRSRSPQKFKITYRKTNLAGRCYTIQTMKGKYLAMDGMAVNGSRLITRNEPYRWYISNGTEAYIYCMENSAQRLNASGQKKEDGTPIITWDLTSTYASGNMNYKFIFEFAK
ncbi:MAG: hypothetical protein RSB37_04220 [Acetivibrio sp.]